MSDKILVIVESPTKAKTITKFLGQNYLVLASNGHIRDLPNNASEIPLKLKKEAWSRLGVNVDAQFLPLYVIPKAKKEHVKLLKEQLKKADKLLLATDEDREGESISWHLVEALKPNVPIKRLVFHEITKEAVEKALKATREIDYNLVRAQETRRIVDRLFGYEVSPLLWKKMAPRLSAGRVQSVAIKLLVERERERISFKFAKYWGLTAVFSKQNQKEESSFEAELTHFNNQRIATGKDFDPNTGQLKSQDKVICLNQEAVKQALEQIKTSQAQVTNIEEKPYSNTPPAPFVTSTLQQEANRKLKYSAKRTMLIAQQLYENGFITYMRTDSTTLSEQALLAARSLIANDFGEDFLPSSPRQYATKVKNAQEAHEAIRPAGASFTPIDVVAKQLGSEAGKLYELVWKRTVASQMKNANGTYITVTIDSGAGRFRASGKTIEFAGFLRAYVEGSDDPESEIADKEKTLPKLSISELLDTISLESSEHSTQPPARYTEGSLIKELEKRGIGRPSTWASIVEIVLNRQYAFKKQTALVPTFTAIAVVSMLDKHFESFLDYEFTARLEDDLDEISRGEAENIKYLTKFYFGNGFPGLKALIKNGESSIDPKDACGITLGQSLDGLSLEVRIGKYGPFISDGTRRTSVPDGVAPDEVTVEYALKLLENSQKEPESLGIEPESGLEVYLKNGPYGYYVQLGDKTTSQDKPKMSSLLKNMSPNDVDFNMAIKLLSLPRNLGNYAELNNDIIVSNGRFGPYIKCGTETRSVPLERLSPMDMTHEDAVELLKTPKSSKRAPSKPKIIREIGNHPDSTALIQILSGRYGLYISDGSVNASLPKDKDPNSITLQEAVDMLESKRGQEPVRFTRRDKKRPKS